MSTKYLHQTKDEDFIHRYWLKALNGDIIELTSNEAHKIQGYLIKYERTENNYGMFEHYYIPRPPDIWQKNEVIKEYLAQQEETDEG